MRGLGYSTGRGLAHFRKLARCTRGVAAIEFAVIGSALSVSILNTADVALYFFDRIQVENAAEMAAEAALKACDITHLPATDNCSGFSDAVSAAVESTSLGAQVTLQSGSPSEGYYCINSDNALEYVSDTSSKPSDCTAAGNPSLKPGDYIEIQASYVYSPLFPGITVAALFPTPITTTAWMRMG